MITKAVLQEGLQTTRDFREKAMTHRTKVGGAIESHGRWKGGFNIELQGYEGYHAQVTSLMAGLEEGSRAGDFGHYVEMYQDPVLATQGKIEIYPMCPLDCWGWYCTFAPYVNVLVADTGLNILYNQPLQRILELPEGADVYPSVALRKVEPLQNMEPLGDRRPLQTEFWMRHSEDIETITDVAFEYRNRNITFNDGKHKYLVESVAFAMRDGRIQGGYRTESINHKGFSPIDTGCVLASRQGYHGTDYETMATVLPSWVRDDEAKPFVSVAVDWKRVLDFANPNMRLLIFNADRKQVFEGHLRDINPNIFEAAAAYDRLRLLRGRLNSEPKLAIRDVA
jgi:hypothetical protein